MDPVTPAESTEREVTKETARPASGGPPPPHEVRRALVCGCEAAGKSTWARRLGEALDLPRVTLDGALGRRQMLSLTEQRHMIREWTSADRWIMDGTRLQTMAERVERAEVVFVFLYSRPRTLWWATKKFVRTRIERIVRHLRRNRTLSKMPPIGFGRHLQKMNRIWRAPAKRYVNLLETLEQCGAGERIVIFSSPREAYAYLDRAASGSA